MAEFFVIKTRHNGVGRAAARTRFDWSPGEWQIRPLAADKAATRFWRSVIRVPFNEDTIETEPRQRFRIDG